MSGTRFGQGIRWDAMARVVAGESASAVVGELRCQRGRVSQWCRDAGVVLAKGHLGGSFEADQARHGQV